MPYTELSYDFEESPIYISTVKRSDLHHAFNRYIIQVERERFWETESMPGRLHNSWPYLNQLQWDMMRDLVDGLS